MKEETQKKPNEVANEILKQHFEGASFGFVKETCESILNMIDIICKVPTSSK